jgi:hypothetical protein
VELVELLVVSLTEEVLGTEQGNKNTLQFFNSLRFYAGRICNANFRTPWNFEISAPMSYTTEAKFVVFNTMI